MGAVHHLLELWALQQSQQGRQGSLELYQLLVNSPHLLSSMETSLLME